MDTGKKRRPNIFKNFGYRVIRLKYFILIVSAMLLEIIVLVIHIINDEKIVYFNLFTGGVLYGATSIIVVVLSIGCIALILTDKSRNKKRIKQFNDFRSNHYKLSNKYSGVISGINAIGITPDFIHSSGNVPHDDILSTHTAAKLPLNLFAKSF